MKRLLDLAIALPALIIALPVISIISVVLLITQGRPIFYLQDRPGFNGKPFKLIKFRTMINAVTSDPHSTSRVTWVGSMMRKTSLDELPQLANVVLGKMSIVGPRPLLVDYLPLYSREQAKRHNVLPGLTGWAQVRGRNALCWPERLALDSWYADNRTIWLDLKIIAMTFGKVLSRSGVDQAKEQTMAPFTGASE